MPIKVSVIIPTLNEAGYVELLLQRIFGRIAGGLLACSAQEVEVIICDGGSTDGTIELCRRYPVQIVHAERGRSQQQNAGAQLATGDVLLFLHADSQIELSIFGELETALQQGAQWGCCSLYFNQQALFYDLLAWASRLRARLFNSCYGDQGIFCRRELFWQVGGFPDLPLMEDLVLSQRLRKLARAWILPVRLVTSTRRFQANGRLRHFLRIQHLKWLFWTGVPAQELADFYRKGD